MIEDGASSALKENSMIKIFGAIAVFFIVILHPCMSLEITSILIDCYGEDQTMLVCESDTRPIIEIHTLNKYDQNDILLLAQLVQAEAGNQDLLGMRYVVDVVLNRVDSELFPDTISEVIFQPGQFEVTHNGQFKTLYEVSEQAMEAVKLEYNERVNEDILYFSLGKNNYVSNWFKHQDHWFGW